MRDDAGENGAEAHGDDVQEIAANGEGQKPLPVEMGGAKNDSGEEHGCRRRKIAAEAVVEISAK